MIYVRMFCLFSSRSFMVLHLVFKFLSHSEFLFVTQAHLTWGYFTCNWLRLDRYTKHLFSRYSCIFWKKGCTFSRVPEMSSPNAGHCYILTEEMEMSSRKDSWPPRLGFSRMARTSGTYTLRPQHCRSRKWIVLEWLTLTNFGAVGVRGVGFC